MGDPKAFRASPSVLSVIRKGDPEFTRGALENIIAGPPKATVRDFGEVLGRLSLHYWRPEMTPQHAAMLNADYVEDLAGVTRAELETACAKWRKDPNNRFYPTSGQLLALMKDKITERKQAASGAEYLLSILERPAPTEALLSVDEMRRRRADLTAKWRIGREL